MTVLMGVLLMLSMHWSGKTRRPESEKLSFLESVALIDPNIKLIMLVLKPAQFPKRKKIVFFSILKI